MTDSRTPEAPTLRRAKRQTTGAEEIEGSLNRLPEIKLALVATGPTTTMVRGIQTKVPLTTSWWRDRTASPREAIES